VTLNELQTSILDLGIRPSAVRFGSGPMTASEQYCIENEGSTWEVYYYERGNKNDLHAFVDECSACSYLLSLLRQDKSVWQNGPVTGKNTH
jgi:hypothetical protein